MRKLINQYKKEGEWKIQLIAEINFISLKPGSDEMRIMYTGIDNEEFMNGDDTNKSLNYSSNHFYKDLKRICKKKLEDQILNLMALILSIIILVKQIYREVDHT